MMICLTHHWTTDDGPTCAVCHVDSFTATQKAYAQERQTNLGIMDRNHGDAIHAYLALHPEPVVPADRWSWREVAYGAVFIALLTSIYELAHWWRS